MGNKYGCIISFIMLAVLADAASINMKNGKVTAIYDDKWCFDAA
jgi:hypothetical protein